MRPLIAQWRGRMTRQVIAWPALVLAALAMGAPPASVALATTAIMPASEATGVTERSPFISIGASTRSPIGWTEFCGEHPRECDVTPLKARDVVLTQKSWKDLVRINRWVNETIK